MLTPNDSGLRGREAPEARGPRGLSMGPSHSVEDDMVMLMSLGLPGEARRGHHVPWQTKALTA